MIPIVWKALAGAAGTLARYGLSSLTLRLLGDRMPFGTLAVNVLGSFLVGLVMHATTADGPTPHALRLPLVVGFLGAFTTFSAFSFETVRLAETGAWGAALGNATLNLGACLAATALGLLAARSYLGGP